MKLSVLLATIGRPCLARTLRSLVNQAWEPGDEVMVLTDDNHEQVADMLRGGGFYDAMPLRHLAVRSGPHKDWGHTPRNLTMHLAKGDYLAHFDDDDVALPTMVGDIHRVLTINRRVHMFRMIDYKSGRLVWTDKGRLQRRHISTQNVVHPNDPKTFGRWGSFYGGDSQFIIQTAQKYPGGLVWQDVVTCVYNPPHNLMLEEVVGWFNQRQGAVPADAAPEARPDTTGGTS